MQTDPTIAPPDPTDATASTGVVKKTPTPGALPLASDPAAPAAPTPATSAATATPSGALPLAPPSGPATTSDPMAFATGTPNAGMAPPGSLTPDPVAAAGSTATSSTHVAPPNPTLEPVGQPANVATQYTPWQMEHYGIQQGQTLPGYLAGAALRSGPEKDANGIPQTYAYQQFFPGVDFNHLPTNTTFKQLLDAGIITRQQLATAFGNGDPNQITDDDPLLLSNIGISMPLDSAGGQPGAAAGGLNGMPGAPGGSQSNTSGAASLTPTDPNNPLTAQTISVGPVADRFKTAQDQWDQFAKASDPAYQKTLRDAQAGAFGAGRGVSGMERTSLGNAAENRALQLDTQKKTFLDQALNGSIDDAYKNVGIAQQQQGFQDSQQKTGFGQGVQLQQLADSEAAQSFYQALQQANIGFSGSPADFLKWIAAQTSQPLHTGA